MRDEPLASLRRLLESRAVAARARGLDSERDWLDALALLDRAEENPDN